MPHQWLRSRMPVQLALSSYSAVPPWRLRSSSRICCWTQCDCLCSWGTSPAYDRRVIPASPCTPPRCTCGRLSGGDLSSSHLWACCRICSRCDPIHSRAHIYCQGPHSFMFRLGTTLPPPWCPSWPCPVPPCSPLRQRPPMTRRFLCSTSSPLWCGGSAATGLGYGSLCLRSPLRIPLASSADLLCLFPCTAREVLHGSLAFPRSRSLRHSRLLCRQSSLLWWWCRGTAEPSQVSHSGAWLPWSCPWPSSLHSWS